MPHPHSRTNRFDEFSESAARVTSGLPFFMAVAVLLVLGLVVVGNVVVQTAIAVVTLLLVALLQNSQRRNEEAVNLKLNAIAEAIADLMRERTGDDQDLRDNIERLAHTVGLEERVTTVRGD